MVRGLSDVDGSLNVIHLLWGKGAESVSAALNVDDLIVGWGNLR